MFKNVIYDRLILWEGNSEVVCDLFTDQVDVKPLLLCKYTRTFYVTVAYSCTSFTDDTMSHYNCSKDMHDYLVIAL